MQDNQLMPTITKGGVHQDHRGKIIFFNDFDMSPIKRFYQIINADETIKRGWRAHQIEQRWFYALTGGFKIGLIKVDDFDAPSSMLDKQIFMLNESTNEVLFIPKGFATCVIALETNSRLMVYADYPAEHAANDNYLYDSDYFGKW